MDQADLRQSLQAQAQLRQPGLQLPAGRGIYFLATYLILHEGLGGVGCGAREGMHFSQSKNARLLYF